MKERGVPASLDMTSWSPKVSLLCSEPGPEKCHRRLVAELLAGYWREQGDAVEIRHLISSRQKPAKPRPKSAGLAPSPNCFLPKLPPCPPPFPSPPSPPTTKTFT